MAAFANANAWLIAKGRAAVVQGFRTFCQVDQHVQLGQRAGAGLQIGEMRQQQVEQFVIKLFFQRQRFALGGQHLIFVFLQLRNNVAFGVFQRLAAHIVDRREVALAAADLDVVAVDGVVADFQGIEAQPLALADLQLIEIIGGAIGQRPPLVQLFAIARGDDPAVADQHRRGVDHRALQQFAQFGELAHFLAQFLHRLTVNVGQELTQQRQLLQGMTHAGKIARPGGTQRQTRQNTLQIADLAQHRLQLGIALLQRADGLLALHQHGGIADRHMQPALEHPATHRRHRTVEYRGQGVVGAAGQILGDLEVTAGGGIHNDAVLLAFHGDGADVRQRGTLGVFDILQQAAGGAQAARGVFDAEADQIAGAELQV